MILRLIGEWNRNNMSGYNSNNKLIRKLASEEIGRSISPFYACYKDTGLFGLYLHIYI